LSQPELPAGKTRSGRIWGCSRSTAVSFSVVAEIRSSELEVVGPAVSRWRDRAHQAERSKVAIGLVLEVAVGRIMGETGLAGSTVV
jgi:hypothetical protein